MVQSIARGRVRQRRALAQPFAHGGASVTRSGFTVSELEAFLRRRELAFRAAGRIGAALVDVGELGNDVQAVKARRRLELVVDALDRIAGRCVRDLRQARRHDWARLPAELLAAIDELPDEEA